MRWLRRTILAVLRKLIIVRFGAKARKFLVATFKGTLIFGIPVTKCKTNYQ